MGSDKGLLKENELSWAETNFQKLLAMDMAVKVSINLSQQRAYSEMFASENLIIDATLARGPLNGILSTHNILPNQDLFVLACDMVDITLPTLQDLRSFYQSEPNYECYCYENANVIEPLCCIYRSTFLANVNSKLQAGEIGYFALHKLIAKASTRYIPIREAQEFANYNYPIRTATSANSSPINP